METQLFSVSGAVVFLVKEIGFRSQVPIIEPVKGFWDQLYLSWEDTERYQADNHGLVTGNQSRKAVTATRLGATEDFGWTYRVLYSDDLNLDHTNPICDSQNTRNCWKNEAYWGVSQVTVDNRRYHATIGPYSIQEDGTKRRGHTYMNLLSDLYEPETEIAARMWIRQSRHGNWYYDISNPTRIFLPAELKTVEQIDDDIKIAWKNTYDQPIDKYEYRLGHTETGRQTDWTTNSWIEACDNDLGTETINNEELQTLVIRSPNRASNGCGPDLTTNLDTTKDYRVQLRAVDDSRRENKYVRNYVHSTMVDLDAPPPTTAPSTTPSSSTPTTPGASTPGGNTPNTQAPGGTTPPATQPPPSPSGGIPPVPQRIPGGNINVGNVVNVIGDNNTVIVGDGNTITFTDTSGSVHQTNIVQLADMGVTRGCNPPDNSRFCPDRAVTL